MAVAVAVSDAGPILLGKVGKGRGTIDFPTRRSGMKIVVVVVVVVVFVLVGQ